jgi:hypothetical protein
VGVIRGGGTNPTGELLTKQTHKRPPWSFATCIDGLFVVLQSRIITLVGIGEVFEHRRHTSIHPTPDTVTWPPALPFARIAFTCSVAITARSKTDSPFAFTCSFGVPYHAERRPRSGLDNVLTGFGGALHEDYQRPRNDNVLTRLNGGASRHRAPQGYSDNNNHNKHLRG